jgi:zinc-ribbon domain/SPOR domain
LAGGAERPTPPSRLRRAREALLLDLGALVYELHRRGKRAPELLQQKAGELAEIDEQARDPAPDGDPTPCPSCGEQAEPGQLVCTSCGTRLALGRGRPDRTPAALAAVAAIVALGAGAAGFAVSELTSDDDGDQATVAGAPEPAPPPAPAAAAGEPQKASQGGGAATGTAGAGGPAAEDPAAAEDRAAGAATPAEPRRLLLDWPDGLTAHTVVLVSSSDRPAALRLARQAAKSGIEAGMLRSDDYNLGTGLWIVFAGRFDTRQGATHQASDLAERFPGAYPQLVEPAG